MWHASLRPDRWGRQPWDIWSLSKVIPRESHVSSCSLQLGNYKSIWLSYIFAYRKPIYAEWQIGWIHRVWDSIGTKAVFGSLISRGISWGKHKKQYSNAFVHKLKIPTQPRVSEMDQQEGKLAVTYLHYIHLLCITRCKSLVSMNLYEWLHLSVGAKL